MSLITTIKERWNAELPAFFLQIRAIALKVGGAATSLWIANGSMGLELPSPIINTAKYIIAACAAMSLTAQLTKKDKDEA